MSICNQKKHLVVAFIKFLEEIQLDTKLSEENVESLEGFNNLN